MPGRRPRSAAIPAMKRSPAITASRRPALERRRGSDPTQRGRRAAGLPLSSLDSAAAAGAGPEPERHRDLVAVGGRTIRPRLGHCRAIAAPEPAPTLPWCMPGNANASNEKVDWAAPLIASAEAGCSECARFDDRPCGRALFGGRAVRPRGAPWETRRPRPGRRPPRLQPRPSRILWDIHAGEEAPSDDAKEKEAVAKRIRANWAARRKNAAK